MPTEPVCETLSLETAPDEAFIWSLSALIQKMVIREGWVFGCGSGSVQEDGLPADVAELSVEEMSAPDSMMPLVLHQAGLMMQEAYGSPVAMAYRPDPVALCVAVPAPQGPTASLVTWALFAHYVLEERVAAHRKAHPHRPEPVPIDPWFWQWQAALNEHTLQMLPPNPIQDPSELPGFGRPKTETSSS